MQDKPKQSVKSYREGVQARTAQRVDEKKERGPVFPNIAQASMEYSAARDGPKTLQQLGEEQRATDAPRTPGFSAETIEGLQALKGAHDAVKPSPVPVVLPPVAASPAEENIEDLDIATVLDKLRHDMINNERERAVVEARLEPIDLTEGLVTGEFTQKVPIIPGKLEVKFRCLTAAEQHGLSAKLFLMIRDNPEMEPQSGALLGLYQTVCTVVQINGSVFPSHVEVGKFNEKIFEAKLEKFMAMPLPLLASIGTNSAWFDNRVRRLFTSADAIKNG